MLLLVEDEPYVRFVVRGMLRGMGYVIREVDDGDRALDAIAAELPALIILNLLLPRVSGLAVLDELRAKGLTKRVPVLVITGSLTPDDIIREKGARGVLRKPFRMRSLRAAVAAVARGERVETNALGDCSIWTDP